MYKALKFRIYPTKKQEKQIINIGEINTSLNIFFIQIPQIYRMKIA